MSTGISAPAVPAESSVAATVRSRFADYAELAKPRITVLEVVTVATAMRLAVAAGASDGWNTGVAVAMLVGTTLLAASANTLNQYLEIRFDRLMTRTADRPLAAGRVRPAEAAALGVACVAVGTTLITVAVNPLTGLLGLSCWLLYIACYTPLKRRTTLNTTIGAVSGAMPIVMGWTAGGGGLDGVAIGLFAVLFFWQYPHFMAIAWLCRDDYHRAGYRMTTVVDPSGRWAGAQAVAGSVLLAPAGLYPAAALAREGAPIYASIAVALSLMLLAPSVWFYTKRSDRSARMLLRASLLYLPAWLLALTVCLP